MPPKPKFTREEIIEAALKIASDKGIKALTSRELGAALGSSARPIFTVFRNMEEVLAEVRLAALAKFDEYAEKAKSYTPVFKQVGLQMIMFAVEQPKLYRLLYMSEKPESKDFEGLFKNLGKSARLCIEAIQQDYGLNYDDAMQLFKHVWIYTYGVGALIASGMCRFSQDEVQNMLSCEFFSMLTFIKSGKADNCTVIPEKK